MVKIISFFINFLNTLHKLLYKFECFLLKFLPNDSNASSTSDAYRRFKVNALPVIEPEHIPISFQQAKEAYEPSIIGHLFLSLERRERFIQIKVLFALKG